MKGLGMDYFLERLSAWAQCNHKGLYKKETRGSKSAKGHMMTEVRKEIERCYASGFREEEWGPWAKE